MLRNSLSLSADPDTTSPATAREASVVSLLGEQRAAIVRYLQQAPDAAVRDIAEMLGVSEVATRRHLAVLEDDGYVDVRDHRDGPGRPAKRYRLTDQARRLFPQRYAEMADELLTFITTQQGRDGLRAYLRWRLEQQTASLSEQVTADELPDRLRQLAGALSDEGFDATVTEDGRGFLLTQEHCAIYDVAREHPEMCTYEAATFSKVLGSDVQLSRRETMATGSDACVCCVTPKTSTDSDSSTKDPR
jgi:predicted ArsR family transcriptional regulator